MEPTTTTLNKKARYYIIASTLLALFLGALDALVMSAAMPTIVAELGGLHLFSWVYSSYLLSRAISLPIFGKLADMYDTKKLFIFSISLFLVSSLAAGFSENMAFLIFARTIKGIAAGGNFALVYIVLSDVALPGKRARTLSLASTIWGISSVIGPSLGGFIVSFFSWRWIFFLNIPLGLFCLLGISLFLQESRKKREKISLDFIGIATLTASVLGLLLLFMTAGQEFSWGSPQILALLFFTLLSAIAFLITEKRVKAPLLNLHFFTVPGFSLGNCATFLSSFSIFALFGYAPLFIQGGLGKSPMQVGLAMLSLSLGWSVGSFLLGRFYKNGGSRTAAILGGVLLVTGSTLTLGFSPQTSLVWCSIVFQFIGFGMGFVSLSTMLLVQNCVPEEDLGVATSFHQFSRSLGGTIGVGLCGGIVTTGLLNGLVNSSIQLPDTILNKLRESTAHIFNPEFQEQIPQKAVTLLQESVAHGLTMVFWLVFISSLLCLICCLCLPGKKRRKPE